MFGLNALRGLLFFENHSVGTMEFLLHLFELILYVVEFRTCMIHVHVYTLWLCFKPWNLEFQVGLRSEHQIFSTLWNRHGHLEKCRLIDVFMVASENLLSLLVMTPRGYILISVPYIHSIGWVLNLSFHYALCCAGSKMAVHHRWQTTDCCSGGAFLLGSLHPTPTDRRTIPHVVQVESDHNFGFLLEFLAQFAHDIPSAGDIKDWSSKPE